MVTVHRDGPLGIRAVFPTQIKTFDCSFKGDRMPTPPSLEGNNCVIRPELGGEECRRLPL